MKKASKNLLLIFTRNPELGKCKTRLASAIGDKAALDIYIFLLEHTKSITINIDTEKRVYYSEQIWEDDIWDSKEFSKRLQQGADLGERMAIAFEDAFAEGFKKVIIIGSDMYNLTKYDIRRAFEGLDNSDFVLGPAEDGGFYLLGMKKMKPELFKNKAWGKNTVLRATLDNLKNEKISLLEERNDVDLYEDIAEIEAFQPFLKHMKP